MPAKSCIALSRPKADMARFVLWADVPAGNQAAYVDPGATSAYENITPAELQAIRDGLVAEKVFEWLPSSGPLTWAAAAAAAVTEQAEWQAEVTAVAPWVDYGRFWNGSTWSATTGVPMAGVKESAEGLPTFIVQTGVSAYAANKFHLVLYNGVATATGQSLVVKIRRLVWQPVPTVATGVLSGPWTAGRREGLTTAPAGTGGLTPTLMDSAQALPTGISAWGTPGTLPAGGTVRPVIAFVPQGDEIKVSTLDAPGRAALADFGGVTVYDAGALRSCRPLVIRPGQTFEVQQDGTAGTGNGRLICVFTVG